MTATLVLATVPHLKEIAGLLRQAAEESNSAFHERKLRRLVTGFEGLVQPFQCIAYRGSENWKCSGIRRLQSLARDRTQRHGEPPQGA